MPDGVAGAGTGQQAADRWLGDGNGARSQRRLEGTQKGHADSHAESHLGCLLPMPDACCLLPESNHARFQARAEGSVVCPAVQELPEKAMATTKAAL